ncbi:MAG: hypothetical protein LLG09_05285 [Negativicutes bacterium]|nr:hypothetical protein [Negativicutes bacterium]
MNRIKQLNICIDIDGTVTEPYYWLKRANAYFQTNLKASDITIYDIPQVLGVQPADYQQFYQRYGEILHQESKMRPGASEIVHKLYDAGQKIHFVTAREAKMDKVSAEWLAKNNIPLDSLTLLGHANKVGKAAELHSDVFIEDSYENVIQLASSGFEVLLIDCNYNQGSLPVNVTRVKNWQQIYKIIGRKANRPEELRSAD